MLVVRNRMRPRADQAHAAAQHVEELRQLVERGAPQEAPDGRDARVVPRRLAYRVVLQHGHRAELEDRELAAVESVAALPEQHRSRRRAPDEDDDCGGHGQGQQQRHRCEDDIARALQHACHAAERRFADGDEGHAADLAEARLHEVESRQVRHEVDRCGRVAQRVDQPADPRMARVRQAEVDELDRVPAHVVRQVREAAQQPGPAFARQAPGTAVVEEPRGRAEPWLLGQARGELAADAVRADDDLPAPDRRAPHQHARGLARRGMGAGQREGSRDEPGEHHVLGEVAGDAQQVARQQQQHGQARPLDRAVAQDAAPVRARHQGGRAVASS